MFWNRYLLPSVLVLLLTAVLHVVFTETHLYWTARWVDIPVHILAGMWVVLALSWVSSWLVPSFHISFTRALLWGLIVGGIWEIGELVIGINSPLAHGYITDTIKDLVDDFIGAGLGYFIMRWVGKK